MVKSLPRFLCALCALALAACTPRFNVPQVDSGAVEGEAKAQRLLVLRDNVDKLDRLHRVAWRIRSSNVELCGDTVVHGIGLRLLELDDYDKEKRELVREVLGVGWRPTVYLAPPGSPAHEAGMRRGDIVLLVSNVHVTSKKEAYEALNAGIKKGVEIPVVVERAGERLTFVVKAVPLCGYPIQMDQNPVVNAYADGQKVVVNLGMMRFIGSDDELAGVLGHELAHNTGQHIRDKRVNAVLGQLLVDLPVAVLTGVRTNTGAQMALSIVSPAYEEEADYVGLYYTYRAGYDISTVPNFWRRMAVDDPSSIGRTTTHPSSNKRFVILEAATAEIESKRAQGLPLRPDKKGEQAKSAPKTEPKAETKAIVLKDARPADEPGKTPAPMAPSISADVDE